MSTAATKSRTAPSSNWKKIATKLQKPDQVSGKKRKSSTQTSTTSKKTKISPASVTDEKKPPAKESLWFADDIDEEDLKRAYGGGEKVVKEDIVKTMDATTGRDAKLGKYVAIDCEMVGVGPEGEESALARVSLVNYNGAVLMDDFVKPQERVTDFRTSVSGITPKHLVNAISFKEAQKKVADIIKDRILVGHAVYNDLKALMLDHPRILIRDTSRYKPFRKHSKGRTPGLKLLVKEVLSISIQSGSHSSVEDARFTMLLYKKVKSEWDRSLGSKRMKEIKFTKGAKTKQTNQTSTSKTTTTTLVATQTNIAGSDDEDDD
ncbi:RNA exonuclease 4 [Umbelopsis sp. PMI_123]|nr:RNA exonuclease 4 [Umbelopsis sp. PMI_123]